MDERTRREAMRDLDRSEGEHGFWPDYLERTDEINTDDARDTTGS